MPYTTSRNLEPMQGQLLSLFAELEIAKIGHFQMESGLHGNLWLHLDKLLAERGRLEPFIDELSERFLPYDVDVICGPQTGGADLAKLIAGKLGKAYIYSDRIVNEDKSVSYKIPEAMLETINGKKIAVVDDVIQAGSAVKKTIADLETHGATVVVIGALMTLGTPAAAYAKEKGFGLEYIANQDNDIWSPEVCPHCLNGESLHNAA